MLLLLLLYSLGLWWWWGWTAAIRMGCRRGNDTGFILDFSVGMFIGSGFCFGNLIVEVLFVFMGVGVEAGVDIEVIVGLHTC